MMEKNNNKKFTVKKISIVGMLYILNDLYANGADYVDLHGEITNLQDTVTMSAPVEYFSNLHIEEEEKEIDMSEITNEILQQLLRNS